MHIPVLKEKAVELWASLDKSGNVEPGIYVDATFGEGGHSNYLLQKARKANDVTVIGIEWDEGKIQSAKVKFQKYIKDKQLLLYQDNYANLDKIVSSFPKKQNKKKGAIRGVLFDFGLNTSQLSENRGFSFNEPEAPLDMRFSREYNKQTAHQILNHYSENQLTALLREKGEERYARRVARKIVAARNQGNKFHRVSDLTEILRKTLEPAYRRQKIHFATRVFQALRLEVNQEIENVQLGLVKALKVLAPGGRMVAISFHSGEDRLAKHFFRQEARDCICPPNIPLCQCQHRPSLKIITKKPIVPDQKEIERNPKASSAKLRAAEKI